MQTVVKTSFALFAVALCLMVMAMFEAGPGPAVWYPDPPPWPVPEDMPATGWPPFPESLQLGLDRLCEVLGIDDRAVLGLEQRLLLRPIAIRPEPRYALQHAYLLVHTEPELLRRLRNESRSRMRKRALRASSGSEMPTAELPTAVVDADAGGEHEVIALIAGCADDGDGDAAGAAADRAGSCEAGVADGNDLDADAAAVEDWFNGLITPMSDEEIAARQAREVEYWSSGP